MTVNVSLLTAPWKVCIEHPMHLSIKKKKVTLGDMNHTGSSTHIS